MNIAAIWDQLVLAVCRPPRDLYNGEDDLVGGRRAGFRLGQKKYYRQDVQLVNPRGLKMEASHYRPCVVTSADGRLPCVVYCHCNSGSRRDAEEILYHLLPKSITVFALDFTGSGQSGGDYVTLGAHEVDDLATAVQYLRDEGGTSTIGLWGRSMGAVTALLYSQRDPSIAGMVLDSPFSRLSDLMMELAVDQQLRIPKPLIKVALAMMRRSVRKRAGFNIDDVSPLDRASDSFIPALFGHARDDTFVNKHHSERLFVAHSGDKNFITFNGDHNSVRPEFWYDSGLIFLLNVLRVQELVGAEVDLQSPEDIELLHRISRDDSIYVGSPSSAASSRGTPTSATAAEASAGPQPQPPSPNPHHALSPPWDRSQMPGHSRRASLDHDFSAAVAHAGAALATERQQESREARGAGAAGPPVLQAVPVTSHTLGLEAGPEGLLDSLEEDAELQQALELSLRDMQQGGQQRQQQAEGGEVAEHRPYNPLYSSSGPENPLYGSTVGSEAPYTREDEEEMLARAIAESLSLQGEARPPEAALLQAQQQVPQQAQQQVSQQAQPQPASMPADWHVQLQQPGTEPPRGLTHSPRMLHAPHIADAQGSAKQHSRQEAAAAHAASAEAQHALNDAMATVAAGSNASSIASPASEPAVGVVSTGAALGQGRHGGLPSSSVGQGGAVAQDEEEKLTRLREQAAGFSS